MYMKLDAHLKPMKFLSTFTGVGGFDLGFQRAGLQCVGMCENDPNATAVLKEHWKDTPKHEDIQTAISSGWANQFVGNTDILIGGAPCQDLSIAGKRAGIHGARSVLFFDMVELAQHVKANYLVYENVPGLLTSNEGRDFAAAIDSLAEAGFSRIEWRTLDSQNFGVPQRRKRIFLVARTSNTSGREVFPVGESSIGDLTSINETWEAVTDADANSVGISSQPWMTGSVTGTVNPGAHPGSYNGQDAHTNLFAVHGPRPADTPVYPLIYQKRHRAASNIDAETWSEGNVTPTLNVFDSGDSRATTLIIKPASDYIVRRLTPTETERLQGFPDDWTKYGNDGKQLSDSARYRAIGNAVTVNVAEYVALLIKKHHRNQTSAG